MTTTAARSVLPAHTTGLWLSTSFCGSLPKISQPKPAEAFQRFAIVAHAGQQHAGLRSAGRGPLRRRRRRTHPAPSYSLSAVLRSCGGRDRSAGGDGRDGYPKETRPQSAPPGRRRQAGVDKGEGRDRLRIARHNWLIEDGGFVPMLDHSAPPPCRTRIVAISWSS